MKHGAFNFVALATIIALMTARQTLEGQASANRHAHEPTIGFVRDAHDFEQAGGALWLVTDSKYSDLRRVFLSDYQDHAIMNVNGRDTRLALVKSSNENSEPRKGAISAKRYRGQGIEVSISYVVNGVCAPDDEKCEVTDYDASVAVRTRAGVRIFRAHGICGS